MNKQKLYSYLDSIIPLSESSNGWYNLEECPYCKHKAGKGMSVNFNYGVIKCWNKCGYRNSIINFLIEQTEQTFKQLANAVNESAATSYLKVETENRTLVKNVQLPKEFISIAFFENCSFGKRAFKYLKGRGFSLAQLINKGIGYCKEGDFAGYIIVPLFEKGKLVYFLGRQFLPMGNRVKNPYKKDVGVSKNDYIYNSDTFYYCDSVYLVEGWSDAMTMENIKLNIGSGGFNGLPNSTKMLDKQIEIIIESPFKNAFICLDAKQKHKSIELASILIDYKPVKILDLGPYKDKIKDNAKGEKEPDPNNLGSDLVNYIEKQTEYLDYQKLLELSYD